MASTSHPADGVDVVLRDGSTVHVRRGTPADAPLLQAFFERLSPDSRYNRFFASSVDLAERARDALEQQDDRRLALLGVTGTPPAIVALGELLPIDADHAEVAFAVDDARRGQGLGTILLAHLAEAATAAGFLTLQAEVLSTNHRMLDVFRSSGLPFTVTQEGVTSHVEAPAALSREALGAFEQREATATAGAVGAVLAPESVAVVGASDTPGSVGGRVLANILAGGFTGQVHAVNRRGRRVAGMAAHRSLTELGAPVDLVVVAVPAATVADVARDAAAIGAHALLVLSAGFSETGGAGLERQRELLELCRSAGMRLVGPNCLGVLNTAPDVRLNATFALATPQPGGVGLMSQSGAVGIALLERAAGRGLGISSFVSAGNKADLSGNDFLQFWERDAATSVVLLYLESVGNPRNFARIARRVARAKPIVVLKSGRTHVGARAAASHTGALVAASDVTIDALFRHAGVIRAGTVAEFLDVAALLERQPLPGGDRVAIVTNAGGPGILCADACIAAGLEVPEPPEEVARSLRADLPAAASAGNPVDMLATADPATFARTVATVAARDDWADAIIVIYVKVADTPPEAYEEAVRAAIADVDRAPPVLWVDMSSAPGRAAPSRLPAYAFPEEAAVALSRATAYGRWRHAPTDPLPGLEDVRRQDAAQLIADRAGDEPRWLGPDDVVELCRCWGIPLIASHTVPDAATAAAAARSVGFPVALKAVAAGLTHKTEFGGVRLGLSGEDAVLTAAQTMRADIARAGFEIEAFIVQPVVDTSVEMLVGVTNDPRLGPLVVCGAGGVRAEVERDVAVRLAPIGPAEATDALRGLRTHRLLEGWRGAPPCDVGALADLVVRTGLMADAHPEIIELDFNPVAASPDGAMVLDARVRVGRPAPAAPWPAVGASPPASSR